jgi:integrase
LYREGVNPARGIVKFKGGRRERFLSGEELERLGSAIREAETTGIPWTVDAPKPKAKHVPKIKRSTQRRLRLRRFDCFCLRDADTGSLRPRWEHVNIDRGCLFLPARRPLRTASDEPEQLRYDLKRPWDAVTRRAGLIGVRFHDLRHT